MFWTTVPKAAVYINCDLLSRKDDISTCGNVGVWLSVYVVSKSVSVKFVPDLKFGRGVARSVSLHDSSCALI